MNEWPHQLMTLLTPLFELCILGLNVFSIIVLVWGVCLAGKDFIKSELLNISERIEKKFGQEVMVFNTFLNPKKSRL